MLRPRLPLLTPVLGAACLVACATSSAPPRTAGARDAAACTKVSPDVVSALRGAAPDAHLRVVVELWRAPRAGDLLQAGVADCAPAPALLGASSAAGAIPWGEYENGPSQLPVMCVGFAAQDTLARWCADPVVHHVDIW